jgi:hypothetical protein
MLALSRMQAFGLLELRRNNALAALMMLERCVKIDPKLQPVLNWTQVCLCYSFCVHVPLS